MLRNTFYNCELVKEFQEQGKDIEYYFGFKDKKVLPNIDTLYVTFDLHLGDYTKLYDWLEVLKANDNEEIELNEFNCFFRPFYGMNRYRFCFEYREKFNIYFCKKKEGDNFPLIYVQIRSFFLWTVGEHMALLEVLDCINDLVKKYNLSVAACTENRIDFAYHCNYIRDLDKFAYSLKNHSVSHFRRWGQEGPLGDVVETDYITLGRKKSNNLFIRIYNKSKEVIERGYKGFFFELWRQNEMISLFDLYVHEHCIEYRSYFKIDYFRLMFYKEHGSNDYYLNKVSEMLSNITKYDNKDIIALADKLVPRITQIVNIEYETKRKFYYSLDNAKGLLKSVVPAPAPLENIFKLLDNKHLIHNLLTDDVFRLVKFDPNISRKRDMPVAPVWKIIQNTKVIDRELNDEDRKLIRSYQRELDIRYVKRTIISGISSLSLYINADDNDKDVVEDTLQFLNFISENDFTKALEYKHKKAPSIKSKLDKLKEIEVTPGYDLLQQDDNLSLLNLTDGTIIE